MPQIIVTAGGGGVDGGAVMLRERVNAADFESERFATNLLERVGWAVEDATAAERRQPEQYSPPPAPEPDLEPDYGWDPEPAGVS